MDALQESRKRELFLLLLFGAAHLGKGGNLLLPSDGPSVFLPFQSLSSVCARAPPSFLSLPFVFSPEGTERGSRLIPPSDFRILLLLPPSAVCECTPPPFLVSLRLLLLLFFPLRPNGKGGREILLLFPS